MHKQLRHSDLVFFHIGPLWRTISGSIQVDLVQVDDYIEERYDLKKLTKLSLIGIENEA